MTPIPKPMINPCTTCTRAFACATAQSYKCPSFEAAFVRSWDEATAFLREKLKKEEPVCP